MMQMKSLAHVDASRYRDAMRRVPAAVTIVTARFEDEEHEDRARRFSQSGEFCRLRRQGEST